jgi:transcriptional regulator with XRE-family HTH domain
MVPRSTGTRAATTLCALLRELRVKAGLTQVEVANYLSRPQSFVSKYETGERRLDLVELGEVCDALGVDLAATVSSYQKRLTSTRAGR